MNLNLDQEVRTLLDARKGDWRSVANSSKVSYSWICKFANGEIPNPGFATLKKLYSDLKGKKPAIERRA